MSRARRSKGFTLAELMLTTAIIIILAALGFIALINYQKDLKLTEMDNAAREIFVAAQNHLTASEKSGEWEEFYTETLSSESDSYDVKMNSEDGHDYYYVIYNPDETDALKNSSLQYLLPFGSIDDTLRSSGSYIIEYDAENASIRSVFFTDGGKSNHEWFHVNSSVSWNEANRLRPTESDQKKQERREYRSGNNTAAIGYYGEASVTKNEVTLKEPTVVIHNDNTLSVEITDPDYGVKDNNGNALVTKLQLVVTGMDSNATAGITLSYNRTSNALSTAVEDVKVPGKSEHYLQINRDILKGAKAEMVTDTSGKQVLKYTITLDQIDNSTNDANLHFAHLFPCNSNEGNRGKDGQYFTAGEDINIRAQIVLDTRASGQSNLSAASVSSSKITNSLFASSEQSDFTYRDVKDKRQANTKEHKAIISNLRHLQNLDPDVSDLEQSSDTNEHFRIIQAEIVSSLNWNSYFSNKTITGYRNGNALTSQGKFYPIDNKRISLLEGKDGSDITIQNLNIGTRERTSSRGNTTVYSGLFARLDDPDDFELTVRNLSLSDLNIDTKDNDSTAYAGGIIGYANANVYIENVHLYDINRNNYKNLTITGGTNTSAGGLVGQSGDSANKGKLNIENSSVSIHVESGQNAGGFIGVGRGTVSINNSYTGGYIDDTGTYSQDTANILSTGTNEGHAGGLIGSIQRGSLTIEDSFATTSVSGRTVGGLIGTSENDGTNISLKNVYYAGAVYCTGTRTGDNKVMGAVIGYQNNANIKTDGYIDTLLGETMIYGSSEAEASHITTVDKETPVPSNGLTAVSKNHASVTHPYSESLQNQNYPYSMNQDKYYGDWIYLNDHARFVITKTIHLDKESIPQDQINTELEFIKDNTGFDVDRRLINDKSLRHYTELYLKDASCTSSDGGYTQACTLNADLDTGYYYRFTEVNNGVNNTTAISENSGKNDTAPHDVDYMRNFDSSQSIKDRYVSQSDDSYLNTKYDVTIHGASETYQRNARTDEFEKTSESKNLTYNVFSGNNTRVGHSIISTADTARLALDDNNYIQFTNPVFDIAFDNTYAKNKPETVNGLIYYEGLSSNPTGEAQRYTFHSVENTVDENGNEKVVETNNLENGTGQYAVDDGYLVCLDDDQMIRFNKYNGYASYYSAADWNRSGVFTELSEAEIRKYGITTPKKVYRINLETLKSQITGGDGDYPGMIIMRVQSGNKEYIYSLNEVFGDCVSSGDNQTEKSFEIRSADQLERFTTWKDSGNEIYSTRMLGQGGYTIHQMLDIDMSGRSFQTIKHMQNCSYEGYGRVKLLNLDSTFIKNLHNNASIKNLILSFNIKTNDQIQPYGNDYGLITSSMEGSHINNVVVQDTIIDNATIGSQNNKANSFGIIGSTTNSSDISDVTFKNIAFNNASVNAANMGLIGNNGGAVVKNLNVDKVSFNDSSINSDNFGGIIGNQGGGSLSNSTINGLNISNTNITGTNAGGIIGSSAGTNISNINIHGLSVEGSSGTGNTINATQSFGGIIGNQSQGSINGITSDGMHITNMNVNSIYAGGVIGHTSDASVSNINVPGFTITGNSDTKNSINAQYFGGIIGYQERGQVSGITSNEMKITNMNVTGTYAGGVIGNTSGGIVSDITLSDASMLNNTMTVTYFGGVTGNQNSTINNTVVHDLSIKDDSQGKNIINAQYFGGVFGIVQGTVNGITVTASDITNADSYGISLNGLKVNSQMSGGVIGYNKGTINSLSVNNQNQDSWFSDIQITGNDFSDSITQYPGQTMYDYGAVIGNNEGTLKNFSMSHVNMTDNTFPSGDTVNIGLLAGINQLNIDNSDTSSTHDIHDLTINDCYGNNKQVINTYAFIGKNSSLGNQWYNRAVINSVVIRDYASDGYGFVYQNVNDGLIQNCSILTTDTDDYQPVNKDNQSIDYDVQTHISNYSVINDSSNTKIDNSNISFS